MPSQAIAQNLAFINWTVLTGLALGSFGIVVLGSARARARPAASYRSPRSVPPGFGVLAWLSDAALPRPSSTRPVVSDPAWNAPRQVAMALFIVGRGRRT